MGATITDNEFLDIILASLLPSYNAVMNALTTSLEEVGKPIEPDYVIRILESQYDRCKTLSISQEEQGFMGTSLKICIHAPIARNKVTLLKLVGLKVVEKGAKG